MQWLPTTSAIARLNQQRHTLEMSKQQSFSRFSSTGPVWTPALPCRGRQTQPFSKRSYSHQHIALPRWQFEPHYFIYCILPRWFYLQGRSLWLISNNYWAEQLPVTFRQERQVSHTICSGLYHKVVSHFTIFVIKITEFSHLPAFGLYQG